MGLDKDTASARISRYESESMTVTPAYLLATTPARADAILALGVQSEAQQAKLSQALEELTALPPGKRKQAIDRLLADLEPS